MSTIEIHRGKCYLVVGILGTIFSVIYLGLSLQLPLGSMRQPGAAVFPFVSGCFLLLGSVSAIIEGSRSNPADKVDVPTGQDLARLVKVISTLVAYLVLLPFLGQLTSSLIFSYLMIQTLSDLSRTRTLVYSVLISAVAYGLFIKLLKLPLPEGYLPF